MRRVWARPRRSGCGSSGGGFLRWLGRYHHGEARSGAGLAVQFYPAAVGLRDRGRDREAEPAAFTSAVEPHEAVEDPVLVLRRYGRPGVLHPELERLAAGVRRKLDRVAVARVGGGV